MGIDPGTTTAIAALDLDGNILHLESSRQMNMSSVIEALYRVGKPLVIASDVQEMPYSVEKIRRAFSAVAYTPRQDTSVDSKLALTAGHPYENVHERDALAAALDANLQYQHKFRNLIKRVPPGHDLDEVRARVIRGQALDQVLVDLHAVVPVTPAEEAPAAPVQARDDERVRVLDGIVKRLRTYVAELQEEIKAKEYEIHRLQARLRNMNDRRDEQIAKDGEVAKRDAIIQSLKKRLRKEERHGRTLAKRVERIRTFAELSVDGAALPVKVLEALTKEGLRRFMDDTGISEGDVIYVQRTGGWGRSVVRDLADLRIRALITPSVGESDPQILVTFQEAGIPLLAGTNTGVQVRGRQGLAPKDRFEAALRLWQEEQVQFLRERESSRIEHMFKEYKSERGKEVRKGELTMNDRELLKTVMAIVGEENCRDDCAVIPCGDQVMVATTDMLHKTTDFVDGMTDWQIGWMSAAVTISDIASMGAEPKYVLIAVGLSRWEQLSGIMQGAQDCCKKYGAAIVGGDIDHHDELTVVTTGLGLANRSNLVHRTGARPGDLTVSPGYPARLRHGLTGTAVRKGSVRAAASG